MKTHQRSRITDSIWTLKLHLHLALIGSFFSIQLTIAKLHVHAILLLYYHNIGLTLNRIIKSRFLLCCYLLIEIYVACSKKIYNKYILMFELSNAEQELSMCVENETTWKLFPTFLKKPLTKQLIVFKACKLYRISNKNSFEKTSHLLLVLLENFKNILGQMMASRSFISLLSVKRTYSLGRWVWGFPCCFVW